MRIGVVTFPGSNSDVDALNALAVAGVEPVTLWHESPDLAGVSGRDPARRLRLRRLHPCRRHRPLLPGDARHLRVRGAAAATSSGSATGSRSWPSPGWCRARCCATARCGSRARSWPIKPRAPRLAVHARAATAPSDPHPDRARRGLLLRRRGHAGRDSRRRPGALPLRPRRRHPRARSGRSGQPQRLAARHRRGLQRRRQRGRA